jgi:hypothetical protein
MPTISVLFPNELQRKLRRRAMEAGVTQRALIPQLVEQALLAQEVVAEPVALETGATKATPSKQKTDEAEMVIHLGPDPEGRDAICGLCGARYKPSGITSHIRRSHQEVE